MNKKKVQTLVIAGVISVGVVGGTLAWFTSQDEVTNIFNTGSENGIEIDENFPGDIDGDLIYDEPVLPGNNMDKEVWIESKATHNQILRARINKGFVDSEGNTVTHWSIDDATGKVVYSDSDNGDANTWSPLNLSYIILEEDAFSSLWDTTSSDGWAYYKTVLEPHVDGVEHGTAPNFTGSEWGVQPTDKCRTDKILDNVTLSSEASNEYKNLRFDVKIVSESVQSTGRAIDDVWATAPDAIKALDTTPVEP